ncbi:hypothetical protein BO94DRAFT_537164 [Aspergillus sclerotioniger CBS 115572]|uniref:Uncharacterized protein n=1 Tax=Aspergillus sclerotioniger CBS 115572 TaxID=1450535 RepID=A0A317W4S6_9EURO|nr:hypothetical protein BO94DRAFT_537164 [Aspergillus sclerotioniger CBS 115572]PWY80287.1 hypothetical protein BO94DRAFT_537164 [Aspergillus sclerotioniger CBS 115572]
MSRMQKGRILPPPLNRPSEDTTHSEGPNHHNPPDIEKYQSYAGHAHLDDDVDVDENDNDDWETLSGNSSSRDRRSVIVLCAACYVAFAILSFFSAAYYFWCLMPYEPSNSNPFPKRQ